MMGKIHSERSSRLGRALIADVDGLAAIEMALILPIALLLMSLIVYGGQLYTVQRKVTQGATTVASLLAQGNNNGQATITAPQLNQILAYPSLILYPYSGSAVAVDAAQLLVTVSAHGTATGTVCGSWANANGTARPIGQQMSVDPSIAAAFSGSGNNNNSACGSIPANFVPSSYVILGEVKYPFQPTAIYFTVSQITLSDSIIMIPRTAAQITVQ
jgi:Flp pilus assembly protein TadG